MNTVIEDTLSFLEQASDILIEAIRKSTDMKDCQDMIFSNIQIIKAIKTINDKCGKTAPAAKDDASENRMITGAISYTVHTDGACSGNPGPGGYGIIIERHDGHRERISRGYRHTTNNRMELMAVLEAMRMIDNACRPMSAAAEVKIISDSKYVIDAFVNNWVKSWEHKGFEKTANSDLWKKLVPLVRKHAVSFEWIRGHAGNPMNEECDRLAVAASKNPTEEDQIKNI